MYRKYKKFIEKYISHNFIEWTLFKSKLTVKSCKKGQTIHHIGDVCTKLAFINRGLARAYMIGEDGKDYTWSIFFNDENSHMTNLFVVDYDSFINQTESSLGIEAIEDCELFIIDYRNIQFLYDKLKRGEGFGRLMSEEAYSYLHKMLIDRQLKTAKERFDEFMQKTPYLLDKVPQYHIATFLGITPQHLSRLKNSHKQNAVNIGE
jgi:CRP-like cAMP-binding protein